MISFIGIIPWVPSQTSAVVSAPLSEARQEQLTCESSDPGSSTKILPLVGIQPHEQGCVFKEQKCVIITTDASVEAGDPISRTSWPRENGQRQIYAKV